MKTVQTQISIAASPNRVWDVLTQDMPKTPEQFGILRIEGQIKQGNRIKLWSEVAPKRAFDLHVAVLEAPRKMVWQGGMPLGLFTGTRSFLITPDGPKCLFNMNEVFTGVLSGLITRSMPDLGPSFKKFANTLKQKAENS